MYGSYEVHSRAIWTLVTHDFRNRQLAYALFKRRLKARSECLTRRGVTEKQTLCFAIRSALEFCQANASAAGLSCE